MTMMNVGTCVGGPWGGQNIASPLHKEIELFRTIQGRTPPTITYGTYKLNGFGQWHWWPTDEGRAADVLFGVATMMV
jgi:hypothetical protein